MSIIKYRTGSTTHRVEAKITPVEVERETDNFVWIKGRRNSKESMAETYHDTWEDAHAHLMEAAEKHAQYARRRLEEANSYLGNVKGMKKPQ